MLISSPETAERVAQLGREAVTLEVPMQVDVKFGRNWGDAKHTWAEFTGAASATKSKPKPAAAPEPTPVPEPKAAPAPEPEPHVCAQCHLNPPDGAERPSTYADTWLHPTCMDDFIRARMSEQNIPWRGHPPPPPPKDRPAEKAPPPPPPITIALTKVTKAGGPLTKRLSLAPDGTLVSDNSACVMVKGTAERVMITGVAALGALIESLTSSQALLPGTLRDGLPDKVEITTTKNKINGVARPDLITRTGSNIIYRGPAFALLDFDTKGMPPTVAGELKRRGGFWDALLTVLPVLKEVARVSRSSTSSGLSRSDNGVTVPGSDGITSTSPRRMVPIASGS